MKILLEGAANTRDLGGMVTSLGTIKPNRLLRSDQLSRLTENDVRTLSQLPLVRVVDLRTEKEMENCPDVEIPNVQYVHVPIIRATTFGITYEKSGGAEIAQMLQAGLERMNSRGETHEQHLAIMYRKFVNDEYSRSGYGIFLKLLTKGVDGATLWHCTAGKDRVGSSTALLLHILGASRQQIYQDYLLTNEQSRSHRNGILNKVRGFVSDKHLALIEIMLSADKAYLDAFYDEAQQKFGGLDGFIAACGVTQQDIDTLRQLYLQ